GFGEAEKVGREGAGAIEAVADAAGTGGRVEEGRDPRFDRLSRIGRQSRSSRFQALRARRGEPLKLGRSTITNWFPPGAPTRAGCASGRALEAIRGPVRADDLERE